MQILFLEAMYGFEADHGHIAVPAMAEDKLKEMVARLVGTDDLVAIYVPEGTEDVYRPGDKRGRVMGAVKLLPMPSGKSIRDYYYDDWEKTRRWPVGWPCQVVFAPPIGKCPRLRDLVESLHGPGMFQPYVARLQYGPIGLDAKMAKALFEIFSKAR